MSSDGLIDRSVVFVQSALEFIALSFRPFVRPFVRACVQVSYQIFAVLLRQVSFLFSFVFACKCSCIVVVVVSALFIRVENR